MDTESNSSGMIINAHLKIAHFLLDCINQTAGIRNYVEFNLQ